MLRTLRSITVLTVILWQSMVLLGSWSVSQQVGDLEHLFVHGQEANHHHHADSTLHMEDEGGPAQHVHADTGNSSVALLTSQPAALADVRSMSPPDKTYAAWLSPALEGPLRPPRLPA